MTKFSIVLGNKKSYHVEWFFHNLDKDIELQFFELKSYDENFEPCAYAVTHFEPVLEMEGYMRGLKMYYHLLM